MSRSASSSRRVSSLTSVFPTWNDVTGLPLCADNVRHMRRDGDAASHVGSSRLTDDAETRVIEWLPSFEPEILRVPVGYPRVQGILGEVHACITPADLVRLIRPR